MLKLTAPTLLLALLCAPARASEPSPFLDVNNAFSASFLKSKLYYIEPGNLNGGNYLDHEDGYSTGARVSLSLMHKLDLENVYLKGEWQGTEGKVTYTGYFLGGPPFIPAGGKSRATIQEANFRFGKGFNAGSHWMLTPFFGWGVRHWVRELGVGTKGDYDESYNFWYWTFGGMFQYSPVDTVVLTADASLGRTEGAEITVSIPGTLLAGQALGSSLYQRYGAEADYRAYKALHVFAGLNYEYFTFGQSAVTATGFYEPFSKTKVYDYTAGVRLSFNAWLSSRD